MVVNSFPTARFWGRLFAPANTFSPGNPRVSELGNHAVCAGFGGLAAFLAGCPGSAAENEGQQ